MKKFLSLITGLVILVNCQLSIVNCVIADDFEPAEEEQNSANTFILDADNTGGDVTLQFGNTLAEYLQWNSSELRFDLSDDFYTEGDATIGDGNETLTVNQDIIATGDFPEVAVVTTTPTNDASIQMTVTGQDEWQLGVDASDSFKFKIDNSNTTGNNTKLTLDGSGNTDIAGTNLTLDSDNTGSGANVSIVANQGSDNDGELRYNASTDQWEYSNDGGTFNAIGSGGGSGDLDDTYDNDADKQMDVDNAGGLSFDLTTGNLFFEDGGTPFLTLYNNSNITYTAPDGGQFTLDGTTTRTSNTPLFNLTANFDTTTAGDALFGSDVDVTRASDDTGQTFGQNIELHNNSLGEAYGLRSYVNQNNASSTNHGVGFLADVSGNGNAGQYGSFMVANGSHTSTEENVAGVVGSGTSASANNFAAGGHFMGENTSTGYSVGVIGQAIDNTNANDMSAGGAFLSMQEIDSTLSSSIVAMAGSETSSGIATDFGVLIRDFVEAGQNEGFITGIGIIPSTLTTGMQIQPPSGSGYTTGIDIDDSQGGTVTTGLEIDAGTTAINVNSGNVNIEENGEVIELGDATANDVIINFDDGANRNFGWDDSEGNFSLFGEELESECGAYGSFHGERGNVSSNAAWSIGNGQTPWGHIMGCDGTVTKFGATCTNAIGTSLDAVIRKNNVATTCTVNLSTTQGQATIVNCNESFVAGDVVGIYAGTEVGTWTECVGNFWVKYD